MAAAWFPIGKILKAEPRNGFPYGPFLSAIPWQRRRLLLLPFASSDFVSLAFPRPNSVELTARAQFHLSLNFLR